MRKLIIVFLLLGVLLNISFCQEIDVFIKGMDDGVKTNKQQDYSEAVMNAKLQAIERAGVEIKSITEVVNFQTKFDMIESKAKAILLPGFNIMDMNYQTDGTYQVVLSGKVKTGNKPQKTEEQKTIDLKNDINGTWELTLSDQTQVQYVSIEHNLKDGKIHTKCNNKSNRYGSFEKGNLSNMSVGINNLGYTLNGSITSDGKKIVGSFKAGHWTFQKKYDKKGTFKLVRQ